LLSREDAAGAEGPDQWSVGGVGTFTVQLDKAFGAELTGVGSTKSVDLVRSIGAYVVVIDYTNEDFKEKP
jgi:NADPH:quinone reductase-like Zn-dependent oxidoreductase